MVFKFEVSADDEEYNMEKPHHFIRLNPAVEMTAHDNG
jgi:hypothetical protein